MSATPGPWEEARERGSSRENEWTVYANSAPPGRKLIAQTYGPDRAYNASLIAAAPDLADALAEYVAEVDRAGLPAAEWSDANLERMRAALRKAGRLP